MRGVACLFAVAIASAAMVSAGAASAQSSYVIATDSEDWWPYEYHEDGALTGIDVDLIRTIAEDRGFGLTLEETEFDASLEALRNGEIDGVISAVAISDEGKQDFDFSEPYFESGVQLAVTKSRDDITSYDGLRGERIAVVKETDAAEYALLVDDEYGFTTVQFDDWSGMENEVASGGVVGYFDDWTMVHYNIEADLEPFKMIGDRRDGYQLGLAVKKGQNAELLQDFNEGLAHLKGTGRYDEIIASYIGGSGYTTVIGDRRQLTDLARSAAKVMFVTTAAAVLPLVCFLGWQGWRRRRLRGFRVR